MHCRCRNRICKRRSKLMPWNRNFIGFNERKRISSFLDIKVRNIFILHRLLEREKSYMENRGWRWSLLCGPKAILQVLTKEFCRRLKKDHESLLQQAIPLAKNIIDSYLWLTIVVLEEEVCQVVNQISYL